MTNDNRSPFDGAGSTRAERPGQVWCVCTDTTHLHHERPERCGLDVFKDGLCRDCYRLAKGSTSAQS